MINREMKETTLLAMYLRHTTGIRHTTIYDITTITASVTVNHHGDSISINRYFLNQNISRQNNICFVPLSYQKLKVVQTQ